MIILLHGYSGTRLSVQEVAQMLAAADYGILMYDMRGHGESEGEWRSRGWQDVADVASAVDFLHHRTEVEHIGIWGHSVGGQVALRAAAEIPEIEAVIGDGAWQATAADIQNIPGLKYRFTYFQNLLRDQLAAWWLDVPIPPSVLDTISQISPRPLLLIAGTKSPLEKARLRGFYEAADKPKELWEIPEAGHNNPWQVDPDAYAKKIIDFFDTTLPPQP